MLAIPERVLTAGLLSRSLFKHCKPRRFLKITEAEKPLIELPHLTELRIYDNSIDADPASGKTPQRKLLLHVRRGVILNLGELGNTPDWAKPLISAALKLRKTRH